MEASIIMQKCAKEKKTFGVRIQKMSDGDWWRTWAFPMKESQGISEGFDKNHIQGNMNATEEYPGCPYCGSKGFFQCGNCHKLTCWNGETSLTCGWCGKLIDQIVEATDKFDVTGGAF